MRRAFFAVLAPFVLACSSAAQTTTLPDAGGGDGGVGEGGGMPIPKTEACTGAMTSCLYGHARTTGFTATPARMQVALFRVFPSGNAAPLMTVPVALDGTWAISNLPPWTHYYVEVAADFGQPLAIAKIVGPLSLPSSAALDVDVPPVQLAVLEQSTSGGFVVDWAEAQVFDPATGKQIVGTASVSVSIAGTSTPMPWVTATPGGGPPAYFVQFSTQPAAQSTYVVSTTPSAGAAATAWTLSETRPTFTGALSSPAAGATIPAMQPLTVSWGAQPSADYEVVEIFQQVSGQWTGTYASAQPDAPDTTTETVPAAGVPAAGTYLVNVTFANAGCPDSASGCVLASTSATAQVTAQ